MDPKEHWLESADGVRLFVREWAAEPPQTGLPVFCLHGLTRNALDFERVGPRIAALGRRVLAMDVRGRGRSGRSPDPGRYHPEVYTADALRVLAALGVESAVWLGTSMGGLLTMRAAQADGPRVAGAILNDIGPVIEPAGVRRIAGYVGQTPTFPDWEAAAAAIEEVQRAAYPDAEAGFWAAFARRTCREIAPGRICFDYDPAIAAGFQSGQSVAPPDMWELFAALADTPLLVVRGALSDLLSAETVEEMRRRKPDLESVEVLRVGHAPTLEEPVVWAAMIDFLARCP